MSQLADHIAAVYRVKSYIILATFAALAASLWRAWLSHGVAQYLDGDRAVSFHHTALVIVDFYLPILAAIGAGVFQSQGAGAAALHTTRHEARVANLFSVLLFSFVLGAPVVAYYYGDAKDVNNWLVGSAAVLSSLLVTGVGYYFGVGKESSRLASRAAAADPGAPSHTGSVAGSSDDGRGA